jgi:pimeloyl-ACP methyl ester carboxylesterase
VSALPPLVLLPGLLCDGALWRAQVDGLAGRAECRVADFTSQDTMAAMAESVLAMMPGHFALAGLSMGGYVAFEVLRRAPERVARLALLGTSARPDTPEQLSRRRGLIALARKGNFKGVTGQLLPLLLHPGRLDDEALATEILAMAGRVGREAFLRQQAAIMSRPDSRPDLVRIACPTMVLCGRQDALTLPAWHTEIAAGIANARLVMLEDCGHLAPMERPTEVSAALADWLAAD